MTYKTNLSNNVNIRVLKNIGEMTNLQEVPTDELLSFHDYPTVHQSGSPDNAQITINTNVQNNESKGGGGGGGGGGDIPADTAGELLKTFVN